MTEHCVSQYLYASDILNCSGFISPQFQDLFWEGDDINTADLGQHITGEGQSQCCKCFCVPPLCQVGHADKSSQCALVHAGLKGHAEIINILLGQDWGAAETPTDPQQHHSNEAVTGKTQAVQQAVTAAASVGHTQVCITSRS